MSYEGLVGTAANGVKAWVPRNVLPAGILRNLILMSLIKTVAFAMAMDRTFQLPIVSSRLDKVVNE